MLEKHVKIIVSEDLDAQRDGANQVNLLINPVYVLRAPFVPTALSIGVTIMTTGFESDNYTVGISIENTELDSLIFDTGRNTVTIGPNLDNFNFTMNLKNLEFMSEGKYRVTIKLKGQNQDKEDVHFDHFFVKANKILGE